MDDGGPHVEHPDDLVDYLIENLESLAEEHGPPTDKLLRAVVTEFLKQMMWDKDNLDSIIRVWGKFPPPDTIGVIGMYQAIFTAIARSKVDLCLTPRYVQLFQDCPTLRIPKEILSPQINRFFVLFEQDTACDYFFKTQIFRGFTEGSCNEFKDFLFNDLIEENVDRIELIRIIILKSLLLFMHVDEGIYFVDIVLCITAALQNTMLQKPVIRNGKIERKRKWDDIDEGLSDILTIIGKLSFYKTMFEVGLYKKNR